MLSCISVRNVPIYDARKGMVLLKGPLPTSLLKMKRNEREVCVNMFNHVLRWTSLINNERSLSERHRILNEIFEIAEKNTTRMDELCLQILKQTRGQTSRVEERNTWKLFSEVINRWTACTLSGHARHEIIVNWTSSIVRRMTRGPVAESISHVGVVAVSDKIL